MSKCCPECTCEERAIACYVSTGPAPAAAVVEPDVFTAEPTTVTEGWQMTGLASGREQLGSARRDVPILRPIDHPVEWSAKELHHGVRVIEVCIDAEDPVDAYVKVLGADAKSVYVTWQQIAAKVGTGWIADEDPF